MVLGSIQVKTEATDGYNAVQVGYQVVEERKITKPELNHLKKFGAPPMKQLREYRVRFWHSRAFGPCIEESDNVAQNTQESVQWCMGLTWIQ